MVESLVPYIQGWVPLFMVVGAPFLASVVVAVAQQLWAGPEREDLPIGAGTWAVNAVRDHHIDVDVGLQPDHAGGDGYWPGARLVALSASTWRRASPTAWAIAAHELGHAITTARRRSLDTWLPVLRIAAEWAGQGFAAVLVVGLMASSELALWVAPALLAVASLLHTLVWADELHASWLGWKLLREDTRLDDGHRAEVRGALALSGGVYGGQVLGRLGVLVAWPWLVPHLAALELPLPWWIGGMGSWLFAMAIPLLVLRAAWGLSQTVSPDPIRSAFRLATLQDVEARWNFLAGMSMAMLVLALYPRLAHEGGLLALTALAAVPAVGPVAGLGRLPVLLPVLVALGWAQRRGASDGVTQRWSQGEPVPSLDAAPEAVLQFFADPPLWMRASRLLYLSFLPLLAWMAVEVVVSL